MLKVGRLPLRTLLIGIVVSLALGACAAWLAWPTIQRMDTLAGLVSDDAQELDAALIAVATRDDATLQRQAIEQAPRMDRQGQVRLLLALTQAPMTEAADEVNRYAASLIATAAAESLPGLMPSLAGSSVAPAVGAALNRRLEQSSTQAFEELTVALDHAGWWKRDVVPAATWTRWLKRLADAQALASKIKLAHLLYFDTALAREPGVQGLVESLLQSREPLVQDAGLSVAARFAASSDPSPARRYVALLKNFQGDAALSQRAERLSTLLTDDSRPASATSRTQPDRFAATTVLLRGQAVDAKMLRWLSHHELSAVRDLAVLNAALRLDPEAQCDDRQPAA